MAKSTKKINYLPKGLRMYKSREVDADLVEFLKNMDLYGYFPTVRFIKEKEWKKLGESFKDTYGFTDVTKNKLYIRMKENNEYEEGYLIHEVLHHAFPYWSEESVTRASLFLEDCYKIWMLFKDKITLRFTLETLIQDIIPIWDKGKYRQILDNIMKSEKGGE